MTVHFTNCTGCHCPGDIISYNCVAPGGLATVWQGSAFNCTGNRISLLHHIINDDGYCNGRKIHGQITLHEIVNNTYTSVLNVTASS